MAPSLPPPALLGGPGCQMRVIPEGSPPQAHPRRLTGTQPRPGSGQPVIGQAEARQGTRTEVQFPCRAGSNTGLWHINERSGNFVEKNCCTPIDKAQKSLGYSTHPQAWYLTCYLGFLPV